MKELGLDISPKNLKAFIRLWWQNPRQKNKGGYWLTPLGFEAFQKADIKSYRIAFENPIEIMENKFIIWLDNAIECPFYLNKKEIYVFGEKTAVQMMLFSGDLRLWHNIHNKNKRKTT